MTKKMVRGGGGMSRKNIPTKTAMENLQETMMLQMLQVIYYAWHKIDLKGNYTVHVFNLTYISNYKSFSQHDKYFIINLEFVGNFFQVELQKFFNFSAAHSPVRLDIETKFLISNY